MTKKEFRTKIRQATGSTGKDTATRVRGLRKMLAIAICLAGSATMCFAQEEVVVINGVKWATRNVDDPGTFAETPESFGKFYQWNRKAAWNTTNTEISGWDMSVPKGAKWEKADDPSPAGWRLPTKSEFEKLLDEKKVSSEWTTQNDVQGYLFTDKTSGNKLFLPAVGFTSYKGLRRQGIVGNYWSATPMGTSYAMGLRFSSKDIDDVDDYINEGIYVEDYSRAIGFSVRCVKE